MKYMVVVVDSWEGSSKVLARGLTIEQAVETKSQKESSNEKEDKILETVWIELDDCSRK